MAHIGRSLMLALAAGAAGAATATLLRREDGKTNSLAKGAVRAGFRLFERARGVVGEITETMSDVVAEVQNELEEERSVAANGDGAEEHVVPFGAKSSHEPERKVHG
ncbi:DUF5132 domain-containing protein [Methylocystis sp. MJC1]|jgi:hypothetical protein|uniref:DUF5132 domain-containing protein n=1 Tax=Methylocystis sp. MJC1 TaxID=2654282 RepID=UPI0013EC6BEE|nr:DUF5132 domain-containing protein [Methylocystis sp. MJC1]KAF2991103.1 hypothetical protein MJC1_01835 [Methylocystis sp. MJC1]MBU6525976.1 DUF5132 domain-containing protein [Methylocystis sp. MJC1]UZX12443.1 DUF5132 domain-containing protein [Methylocystis sp. MJC1]